MALFHCTQKAKFVKKKWKVAKFLLNFKDYNKKLATKLVSSINDYRPIQLKLITKIVWKTHN